jgi:Xaa-Pro aminopeptidase
MAYLPAAEHDTRVARVRQIMSKESLDVVLVYYDEFNIGNGWYLSGWCPQFESGAVLVPREGSCLLLGGPESEPFAKTDSAVTETRNFPVFMVPDEEYPNATIIDFPKLFSELNSRLGAVKRVGLVGGGRMPAACYQQIVDGFKNVQLVDVTEHYVRLRFIKSEWERQQIRAAFRLADGCYDAMKGALAAGTSEIEVAAAGEFAARSHDASGFGFSALVAGGQRSNAVVPTASARKLRAGEMALIGLSPKVNGYAGVMGDTLPVNGECTSVQKQAIRHLREAFVRTREALAPGRIGKQVDAPAREYFAKAGLSKYLVCPFVHTIGLHEAEAPFFGPNSSDEIKPGMTICVDVSFFGHPEYNGARIETGYEVTADGIVPLSPKLDRLFTTT